MKTIWVVQYNDGTADVFDEDKGPPSWPYVDAFEAKQRIVELETELVEEARLNGMGAEREAKLLARVTELEETIRERDETINWYINREEV